MDSPAISRRAAERHALAIAAGAPRSTRWAMPAAGATALGAAIALPLLRPAALALAAVTLLLLGVHRQDRRDAWRWSPEPATPARFLPPRRRAVQDAAREGAVLDRAAPVVDVVAVPTQPVPVPALPRPRGAAEHPGDGDLPAPAATPVWRAEG